MKHIGGLHDKKYHPQRGESFDRTASAQGRKHHLSAEFRRWLAQYARHQNKG
jgi:hypothetical protein